MIIEKLKERFEKKVIKNEEGCWDWKTRSSNTVYPQIYYQGKPIGINRASWMVHKGERPDEGFISRECNNKRCTRPDHLVLSSKPYMNKLKKEEVKDKQHTLVLLKWDTSLHKEVKLRAIGKNMTMRAYILQSILHRMKIEKRYD